MLSARCGRCSGADKMRVVSAKRDTGSQRGPGFVPTTRGGAEEGADALGPKVTWMSRPPCGPGRAVRSAPWAVAMAFTIVRPSPWPSAGPTRWAPSR